MPSVGERLEKGGRLWVPRQEEEVLGDYYVQQLSLSCVFRKIHFFF